MTRLSQATRRIAGAILALACMAAAVLQAAVASSPFAAIAPLDNPGQLSSAAHGTEIAVTADPAATAASKELERPAPAHAAATAASKELESPAPADAAATADATEPEPPAPAGAADPPALPSLAPYIKEIEEIRGLTFTKPVASGRQSAAEFRRFVEEDLDKDLPASKAACVSRVLARLGLLPDSFDLRRAFSDLLSSQVAAYYNPYERAFFVVRPDLPESLLQPTITHELTHALQDQRFDLAARVKALQGIDNDDRQNAFRFLAEGEATYVMTLAALRAQGIDPRKQAAALDSMIDAAASLGREQLAAGAGIVEDGLGKELASEIEAVLSYPDYLFRILFDPYFGGQRAVHHVHRAGGWAAVNELWRKPPASTELFLHPEKLTQPKRDEPVAVEVPDLSAALGAGYATACENTLGELETLILLEGARPSASVSNQASSASSPSAETRPPEPPPSSGGASGDQAKRAAAGWGGDRFRAFEREGGRTIVVWQTVWDTENDALEFDDAMKAAAKARFPDGAALPMCATPEDRLRRDPSGDRFALVEPSQQNASAGGAAAADRPGRDSSGDRTPLVEPSQENAAADGAAAADRSRRDPSGDGAAPAEPPEPCLHLAPPEAAGKRERSAPAGVWESATFWARPAAESADTVLVARRQREVLVVAGGSAEQASAVLAALGAPLAPASRTNAPAPRPPRRDDRAPASVP